MVSNKRCLIAQMYDDLSDGDNGNLVVLRCGGDEVFAMEQRVSAGR